MAIHPFKTISLKLALKKAYRHPRSRGIIPLKEVKSATVLIDGMREDAVETHKDIEKFFRGCNIPVTTISVSKGDVNMFGLLRKKVRRQGSETERDENLFISIIGQESDFAFASEHEAVCSPATFKVARWQIGKEEIIDFVVLPPETGGADTTQREVFHTITEYLKIIK